MPRSEISKNLVNSLVELNEHKLATRVLWCDLKADYLALRSRQIQRLLARHNARVRIQELVVKQLDADIPRIVMSRTKK